MKHRLFSLTLALLLLITVLSGCAVEQKLDAAEDTMETMIETNIRQVAIDSMTPAPETKVYASPTPEQLTHADALRIALEHSGYSEDQVHYLNAEFEIDDRIPQYDVQFFVDYLEYEYEIHAESGDILSFEKDR